MKPKNEQGAANTAKRLESHEADAEAQIVRLKDEIARYQIEHDKLDGAEDRQGPIRSKLAALRSELNDAYDLWFRLSKQVREYDKSVSSERREGEKILRSEVEEFFQQYDLSLRLAIESYIIALSQDACRAESPDQFYQAHAGNLRSCVRAAIDSAVKDGKLPKWAMVNA